LLLLQLAPPPGLPSTLPASSARVLSGAGAYVRPVCHGTGFVWRRAHAGRAVLATAAMVIWASLLRRLHRQL